MKTYYIHNFNNSYGDFTINNYKFMKFKESIPKGFGDLITHKCVLRKQKEKPSVLYDKKTELDDICFLLSLFFSYDIYSSNGTNRCTYTDCRLFRFNTMSECIIKTYSGIPYYRAIKKVLSTIQENAWLNQFNNGSHLILLKEALKVQSRESQYLNFFIIWEHLFYLHNKSCKTFKQIINTPAKQKLTFLLTKYNFKYSSNQINKLQELVRIRNTIVHDGVVPEYISYPKEFWLFYDLTQFLVAKTLNLEIGSILGADKKFIKFLNEPRRNETPI